jgi:hypothetical protein
MVEYANAMGGPEACEPAVLDLQLKTMCALLDAPQEDHAQASKLVAQLSGVVRQKIAKARKAA